MRLLSLKFQQYRNYGELSISCADDLLLLIGPNGSGKTNFLEAIAMLSLTKSFLEVDEEDLRQWGTDFYRVSCTMQSDSGEETELELVSQVAPRRAKACFRNGVKIGLSEMVGLLPTASFLPQDLSLFTGPPVERRRFIDQILCQVSPEYLEALMRYQRVLKQRNACLRAVSQGLTSRLDLDPWDQELSLAGATILSFRRELVGTFNLTLCDEVQSLGEGWPEVQLTLEESIGRPGVDRAALAADLLEGLRSAIDRDVHIQSTTVGPHRDDWHVTVSGRNLRSFASRGQQRAVILALLFLQASFLEIRRGERPIILLDDIFSELDQDHCRRVLTAFPTHQVFLSATDAPEGSRGRILNVEEGSIAEKKLAKKAH